MAASSSSLASTASSVESASLSVSKSCALFSSSSQATSVKLDRGNFLLWESVVLSLIEGNQLESHIDGTSSAPPRRLEQNNHFASLSIQPSVNAVQKDESMPRFADNSANRGGFLDRRTKPPDGSATAPFPLIIATHNVGGETEQRMNVVPTGISLTPQVVSTASPSTVHSVPRGVRSSHTDSHLNDSRDTSRDAGSSCQSESGASSSNLGQTNVAPLDQAPTASQDAVLNTQAQNCHPMVTRARDGIHKPRTGIFLNQSKYIQDLLRRFHMSDCAPASTPMVTGRQFSKDEGDPMTNVTLYRQAVGSLQYLTTTRPDISYSVNKLSQFMASPTDVHFQGVKRIFRYLKVALERSTPLIMRCCKEIRPDNHCRFPASKLYMYDSRSRTSKRDRFPKFGGMVSPKSAFDKFRYFKFSNDPKKLGIGMPLNVLKLKSKCFNDLSFIKDGLISPLNEYLQKELNS
ncbi:Copia protein [Senna tora]|uniref:Copia protein n=1 Tax=Senna tora TaxID=362788 RepID=A0A834TLC5_9FABA|nr:Copia protein [Senna tora]